MALQYIPPNPSAWANLGAGLSSGIQTLIDEQIKEMAARRERQRGIQGLIAAGVPQEQAEQLIHAQPGVQKEAIRDILQTKQGTALGQAFGALAGGGAPPVTVPSNVPPVEIGRTSLGALQAIQQPGVPTGLPGQAPAIGEQPAAPIAPAPTEPAVPEYDIAALTQGLHPANVEKVAREAFKERRSAKHDATLERIARKHDDIMKQRLNLQEKIAGAKSISEAKKLEQRDNELAKKEAQWEKKFKADQNKFEKQEERIEQHHIDKEVKPFFDTTIKEAHAGQNGNIRLSGMEELIKKDQLPSAVTAGINDFFKRSFRLDLSALLGADAETFAKITADFSRSAKDYFGSRLTDADLSAFLASVPTLMQSNAGKMRVINSMRIFNDLAIKKRDVMSNLIKQNNNKKPANLELLVDETMQPEIENAAEKFKNNILTTYTNTGQTLPRYTPGTLLSPEERSRKAQEIYEAVGSLGGTTERARKLAMQQRFENQII